jgi:hypothetical protein
VGTGVQPASGAPFRWKSGPLASSDRFRKLCQGPETQIRSQFRLKDHLNSAVHDCRGLWYQCLERHRHTFDLLLIFCTKGIPTLYFPASVTTGESRFIMLFWLQTFVKINLTYFMNTFLYIRLLGTSYQLFKIRGPILLCPGEQYQMLRSLDVRRPLHFIENSATHLTETGLTLLTLSKPVWLTSTTYLLISAPPLSFGVLQWTTPES